MVRWFAMVLLALATACASSPVPPNAASDITAWVHSHYGERFKTPQMFYGDFTGDHAPDALVWVMYNDGGVRNFSEASLFRGEQGRLVYWRTEEAVGQAPRDVKFMRGRITWTTTVLEDSDARCRPTGAQSWTIDAR